ncbi:MAG: YbhB/YbcL family Raf kinase inhibitor-like protein [Endomicrobiales bacterium]
MKVTSPDFANNGFIPERFTCEGDSVNPTLLPEDIPPGAKSLALIVDDVDAAGGGFIHWIVYDIPLVSRIEEDSIPGTQGTSSAKRKNYAGPCPPAGTHHYYFKLYALDAALDLPEGTPKDDVVKAMQGRIIGQAELVGLYRKKVQAESYAGTR